jgi:hypothetical protein
MSNATEARANNAYQRRRMEESIIVALNYAFETEDEEMREEILNYAKRIGRYSAQNLYDISLCAMEREEEILDGKDF